MGKGSYISTYSISTSAAALGHTAKVCRRKEKKTLKRRAAMKAQARAKPRPKKHNKMFKGEKGTNPSGGQQRRIPLQDGQKKSCDQKEALQVTTHSMDMNCMNNDRRHGP